MLTTLGVPYYGFDDADMRPEGKDFAKMSHKEGRTLGYFDRIESFA